MMTQIRVHGTRAFSDYIIYAVINRGVTITTSDELTTIVRACYIANTNDDESKGGRKSNFLLILSTKSGMIPTVRISKMDYLTKKG